ncbi:hypothetical protein F7310_02015 [Francisella uliginis]|uniref:Type I restriction modification DNA specificity domain-containing protein n=1 Tax=Francisella uliginis TaxID=573570 RepID=A0A1L4BV82_9GAMM|nr:hypothetical protein F7310_02015 [Francisella uliginis]
MPELRFPEFRDAGEWVERELGEVAKFLKGKGISKSDIVDKGNIPCIRYGELYTCYNEIIEKVISKTNINIKKLVLSKFNDVLIPSSGETQEDIATASCIRKDNVALGGDLNIIRTKENGSFLAYYFSSVKKREISQMAQGVSVIHLYVSQLKMLKINIPTLKEQQKIADCLSSVDELIEAQSQKVELLKEHKKGLMQKLFPSVGGVSQSDGVVSKNIPELRFPEFRDDGEWVERELGGLCISISSGKDRNIYNGTYDLYGSTGIIGKCKENSYIGNYILVARVGANAGLLTKVSGNFGVTDNTLVLNLKKTINIDYVYYFLSNYGLNKLVFGSGQPLITGKQLKLLNIFLPAQTSEQQKIADCLSSVDELIEAQSQKVELLKEHKKGLMQRLFSVTTST